MKIVFLKDKFFFLKGQKVFYFFLTPAEQNNPCLNDKRMMLYSFRYVNFRVNMPAKVITETVATL